MAVRVIMRMMVIVMTRVIMVMAMSATLNR
jgi:hypothetical protein